MSNQQQKKVCLFIRGFNTNNRHIYDELFKRLELVNYNIVDYSYENNKKFNTIITNVKKIIDTNQKIETIITHSMGGLILTQIPGIDLSKYKIIMLNPYIDTNVYFKNRLFNTICNNMLTKHVPVYLPQYIVLNNANLSNKYNDDQSVFSNIRYFFTFINLNLVKKSNRIILNQELLQTLINKNSSNNRNTIYNNNIHIIYACDDSVAPIRDKLLIKIKQNLNLHLVVGKHESLYNEYDDIKNEILNKTIDILVNN